MSEKNPATTSSQDEENSDKEQEVNIKSKEGQVLIDKFKALDLLTKSKDPQDRLVDSENSSSTNPEDQKKTYNDLGPLLQRMVNFIQNYSTENLHVEDEQYLDEVAYQFQKWYVAGNGIHSTTNHQMKLSDDFIKSLSTPYSMLNNGFGLKNGTSDMLGILEYELSKLKLTEIDRIRNNYVETSIEELQSLERKFSSFSKTLHKPKTDLKITKQQKDKSFVDYYCDPVYQGISQSDSTNAAVLDSESLRNLHLEGMHRLPQLVKAPGSLVPLQTDTPIYDRTLTHLRGEITPDFMVKIEETDQLWRIISQEYFKESSQQNLHEPVWHQMLQKLDSSSSANFKQEFKDFSISQKETTQILQQGQNESYFEPVDQFYPIKNLPEEEDIEDEPLIRPANQHSYFNNAHEYPNSLLNLPVQNFKPNTIAPLPIKQSKQQNELNICNKNLMAKERIREAQLLVAQDLKEKKALEELFTQGCNNKTAFEELKNYIKVFSYTQLEHDERDFFYTQSGFSNYDQQKEYVNQECGQFTAYKDRKLFCQLLNGQNEEDYFLWNKNQRWQNNNDDDDQQSWTEGVENEQSESMQLQIDALPLNYMQLTQGVFKNPSPDSWFNDQNLQQDNNKVQQNDQNSWHSATIQSQEQIEVNEQPLPVILEFQPEVKKRKVLMKDLVKYLGQALSDPSPDFSQQTQEKLIDKQVRHVAWVASEFEGANASLIFSGLLHCLNNFVFENEFDRVKTTKQFNALITRLQ